MSQKKPAIKPWKTLSSVTALDEKWFPVRRDTVQLPSGRIVDDYFIWESPKIVMTVPVTPDGQFVTVRQYRHAIGKILTQFPGGGVDPNEPVAEAALRELEEETGYTSRDKPIFLGKYAPYSTKITCEVEVYLIINAKPNGHPHYDDQEETEVVVCTTDELLSIVDSKEVVGADFFACTLLALRYLNRLTITP